MKSLGRFFKNFFFLFNFEKVTSNENVKVVCKTSFPPYLLAGSKQLTRIKIKNSYPELTFSAESASKALFFGLMETNTRINF